MMWLSASYTGVSVIAKGFLSLASLHGARSRDCYRSPLDMKALAPQDLP
jgi:hypothetical protein